MGKPIKGPKGERLNQNLCVDDFKICVPKSCRLLRQDWTDREVWIEHVKSLYLLAYDKELQSYEPKECMTCDCKPGWRLTGELAVQHACRIHEKIHRQVLGLEQVAAIDVGFAISERETIFEQFLAIRVHVNQKLPPEQLLRTGLANLTQATFAFDVDAERTDSFALDLDEDAVSLFHAYSTSKGAGGPKQLGPAATAGDGSGTHPQCCPSRPVTCNEARKKHLFRLLRRAAASTNQDLAPLLLGAYPVTGIRREDLSVFCPKSIEQTRSLRDVRLCICGVPIDIINAKYYPSITHPGGDADSGVFVGPPQRSDRLPNEELRLIGRGRVNPLVGGSSVGTITGQAGTLGTIVWDRTDGTPCVLSNWHVLAGTPRAKVGQPTFQPALFDGGDEGDIVARLKRWHLGDEGDAAIAELTGSRHYAAGEILGLWNPISGYLKPRLNMEVRKWGRTTGFTQGFIDGINLATNIDYGNGVVRYFSQQFHIAPLHRGENVSQVGDSGSLVVTRFKPLEQQKSLELLVKWFKICCQSRGCDSLCHSVVTGLNELKAQAADCNIKATLVSIKNAAAQCQGNMHREFVAQQLANLGEQASPAAIVMLNELVRLSANCTTFEGLLDVEIQALPEDLDAKIQGILGRIESQNVCKKISDSLQTVVSNAQTLCKDPDVSAFLDGQIAALPAGTCPAVPEILEELKSSQDCRSLRVNLRKRIDTLEGTKKDFCSASCGCEDAPSDLCRFLTGEVESFTAFCLELRNKVETIRRAEQQLAVLLKRCEACEVEPAAACKRAEAILAEVPACNIKCTTTSPIEICRRIEHALECTFNIRRAFSRCLSLCDEVVQALEEWLEQCCEICCAPKRCKKICDILHRHCSDDLLCKDPIELVKCIESNLPDDFWTCDCGAKATTAASGSHAALNSDNPLSIFLPGEAPSSKEKDEKDEDEKENHLLHGDLEKDYLKSLQSLGYDPTNRDESWFLQILKSDLGENQGEEWFAKVLEAGLTRPWFLELVKRKLGEGEIVEALVESIREFRENKEKEDERDTLRAYYAVGLIFAGDTPGSPFGEFAVASDIECLAEELRFSLRPVFEPRSSFRELRVRPTPQRLGSARRGGGALSPGAGRADDRGGGPQPEIEPAMDDSGNG